MPPTAMQTARAEITEIAQQYNWEALKSPRLNEMIYRCDNMLVFIQYDRDGKMREAELRRLITRDMTTEVAKIVWTSKVRLWHVTRWFTEHGKKPTPARRRR